MLTTTSEKNPFLADVQPTTSSARSPCEVVEIDKWREIASGTSAHSTPLNVLVQEYESDPRRKTLLSKARQKLAKGIGETAPNTLRSLRLQRGLSQTALAIQIGSTQAQIARIETGRPDVQISTLLRLAEALEIDLVDAIHAFVRQRGESGQ